MHHIRKWNDWNAAIYKKAAQELVEKKLVIEAKRKRAGRNHFIPGAWLDLKAPDIPLELWKLPLYDLKQDKKNTLTKKLQKILPLKPMDKLFEEAYNRISCGDIPKLENAAQ